MRLPALLLVASSILAFAENGPPLEGTEALTVEGDLSAQMVAGIDRWLMRETERAGKARGERWPKDNPAELPTLGMAVAQKRELLRKMLGMVDLRTPGSLEILREAGDTPAKAEEGKYRVERVRWPVFEGVYGEGLLLCPAGPAKAAVMILPDADQTPEQSAGVQPGLAPEAQFARRLAERGALVLVMRLIDRNDQWSGSERLGRWTNQPHREWIYRQAFEVGRTLIGYEVEKVFAGVDALRGSSAKLLAEGARFGLLGYGEGGRIALHAAALSVGLEYVMVSGAIQPPESMWRQPIDRNLMGFAREFGDRELCAMISSRTDFRLEYANSPIFRGPPAPRQGRAGAAPGILEGGSATDYLQTFFGTLESWRSEHLLRVSQATPVRSLSRNVLGADGGLDATLPAAKPGETAELDGFIKYLTLDMDRKAVPAAFAEPTPEQISQRQRRAVRELEAHTQRLLRECAGFRDKLPLWTKLKDRAAWPEVQKAAKTEFWEKVIGKISTEYLPAKPRSRQIYDQEKWRGYDVMLDVHPDIFAWGILLVPKDLKPGEKRPVVVCQHGLEGLPADTINDDPKSNGWGPYKAFAAKLAERGFIVYAPHNPYRGQDKFRVLQRKANPLGLTLFSFIIAQHDVTTQWLASLPFVDPERIGFYGLSYGGKSAMRIPAALDRYCLSICSADFNEWVMKNATTEHPFGYTFTNEYEIFEWDLGHTFNYAEMALLIAPRPFMVERGHDDGVGTSDWVGYEFGRVRRGYDKLGIADRAEIEWFDGPHTINGVGTYKFLHKWLKWPER